MRHNRWVSLGHLGCAAVAATLCAAARAQPPTREDWHPPLPFGYSTDLPSVATTTFWSISPDGTTVYGTNGSVANDVFTLDQVSEAFSIRSGLITAMRKPTGLATWGWPRSACADGAIAVGGSLFSWDAVNGPVMRPTMWYTAGFSFLMPLPSNATGAGFASDISWDSSTVVGSCWRTGATGNYLEPMRWFNFTATTLSHGSRPEDTSGLVTAISGNGQRAVGILGQVDAAGHWVRWHSVIWDNGAPGPVELTFTPPLTGTPSGCPVGLTSNGADARISYDGSVIVFKSAACTDTGGAAVTPWNVVRWENGVGTVLTGMTELGGMNSNGSIIVGSSSGDPCTTSVGRIWDPVGGVRDLHDTLASQYGADVIGAAPSASFMIPRGMSSDGRTIVGIAMRNCVSPTSAANASNSAIIRLPYALCAQPQITFQSGDVRTCWRGSVMLSVFANSATGFQWRKGGVDVRDVPGHISGAKTGALTISPAIGSDSGVYDCVVSGSCSPTTSSPMSVSVCVGDFNCSNSVTVADIFAYLSAWFAQSPSADINGAGGVTVSDIFAFLSAWFAGC